MTKEEFIELVNTMLDHGIDEYEKARLGSGDRSYWGSYWDGYSDALEKLAVEASRR